MDIQDLILRFGVALGLGAIVGLQREFKGHPVAGIRTYPLIALLGALCAWWDHREGGHWITALGFFSSTVVAVSGNFLRGKKAGAGQTTEFSILLVFLFGALTVAGPDLRLPLALTGALAVILQSKRFLHRMVGRIGKQDLAAIMLFVFLALVILPVLPRTKFGPYDILNLFEIWFMVVLIVGINLTGYLIFKFMGGNAGSLLAGILGGLISSTATTISYAQKSRSAGENKALTSLAARVVVIATTIVYFRIILEISAVAARDDLIWQLGFPLGIVGLSAVLGVGLDWVVRRRREPGGSADKAEFEAKNPAELKTALIFAGLYALILVGVEFARRHTGEGGVYLVAVLSGLTDVDAITLSTSKLVRDGNLEAAIGARTILLASLSNLVFKYGIVLVWARREMVKTVGILFGLQLITGVLVFFLV